MTGRDRLASPTSSTASPRAIGRAVAWLALAIVLLQFALVIMRYVLDFGSIWLTEAVIYAHAALFLLAAAWTCAMTSMCASTSSMPRPRRARRRSINLVGALVLLLPFALVLAWFAWPYVMRSWAILERSHEIERPAVRLLLKTLILLFAGLMALQGIAQAIRAAQAVGRTGRGG